MTTLSEARDRWLREGGDAATLLEVAREYADERGVIIPGVVKWEQAELLLHAIAQEKVKAAREALRLWKTSPGASGRIVGREADDPRPISVSDAAEAAGVNRSYVKAEIVAGRLAAIKNATGAYEITQQEFRRWQNNPRRGSRKRSE